MAWTQNLLGLCLFGCAPDAAFLGFAWWLQFRSGWGTISLFIVFRGSKSNVSRFLRLQFRNGLDAKPAGALPFRMRSRRSFLRLCLVAEVSQWLGHDFVCCSALVAKVNHLFLRLCLVAEVSQWLGYAFFVFFVGSKSNASAFFWLCFRMAWVFLGVPKATQWLRHVFIVFMGLDFIVFRGSKSNVSRFLRLHSCNGLDAKPAGALPFRMRSRRSFLGLCLVAAVSQWLGHDFIVHCF